MRLYLVQHGQAVSGEDDKNRPLTQDGWNEVEKVARLLAAKQTIKLEQIFHSGKIRARQTAMVLADFLNPPKGIKGVDSLDGDSDPSSWLEQIRVQQKDMMLVGHLPHLSRLCSRLMQLGGREAVNFKHGGVLCLERNEQQQWNISWYLPPQLLR